MTAATVMATAKRTTGKDGDDHDQGRQQQRARTATTTGKDNDDGKDGNSNDYGNDGKGDRRGW
jgi:hypothetical protein